MHGWGLLFAVAVLLGGSVGFGMISTPAVGLGQILFFLGIVGLAVSLVLSATEEVARQR
jgi:uncharacterized membrane protein YtjA (UPF0391 family)